MWTVTSLSDLRQTVKDSLQEGLSEAEVFDYTERRWTPPVVVITPAGMTPATNGEGVFGSWNVPLNLILIVDSSHDADVVANELDKLVLEALNALEQYDITSVTAPGEVELNINGSVEYHWGVVIALQFNTKIIKEDA